MTCTSDTLKGMPNKRTVSKVDRELLKGCFECERELKGIGLTFLYCSLTDGIIDLICSYAHKISSKEDLLAIVPGLEEWSKDIMKIFYEFYPETIAYEQ